MTTNKTERPPSRKSAESGFFPLPETTLTYLRQTPRNFGVARSRWTLALLKKHCPDLGPLKTQSGVWRRLHRGQIRWRQGRLHLYSPDPDYAAKAEAVQMCLQDKAAVVLFGDEMTFYRHPAPARAYAPQGYQQEVRADLGHKSNTKRRLCGALDARSGQVNWTGGSKVGVAALCRWLGALRAAYAAASRLVLVWDNWPVHKHEKVVQAAEAARIELVFLPTYAPWLNPIEKLWRKLKQDVLSLHRFGDDWTGVQEAVTRFLNTCTTPSPELLQYVGLGYQAQTTGLAD